MSSVWMYIIVSFVYGLIVKRAKIELTSIINRSALTKHTLAVPSQKIKLMFNKVSLATGIQPVSRGWIGLDAKVRRDDTPIRQVILESISQKQTNYKISSLHSLPLFLRFYAWSVSSGDLSLVSVCSTDDYLAVMLILGFLHRLTLVRPDLRDKFPCRQNDPAVTRFHSCCGVIGTQRQIGVLKNKLKL